jgi:hypothetical protein
VAAVDELDCSECLRLRKRGKQSHDMDVSQVIVLKADVQEKEEEEEVVEE